MIAAPKHRTPKVKEFVRPPFVTCPDCGVENKFGVLMICDHHYVRRCINCWFDKRIPLPQLRKKIIYLDQFVISNMMKELDPDRPAASKGCINGFYLNLFKKLDRLHKLHLIVCVDSPLHDEESVVDSRYENIRKVFLQLSHGVSFLPPETIFFAQIMRAFDGWLRGQNVPTHLDRTFVIQGNPDAWNERYRIDLNYIVPGLVAELKSTSTVRSKRLYNVCVAIQQATEFDFGKMFCAQLLGLGTDILTEYQSYLTRFAAVQNGTVPADATVYFPPSSVNLITRMLSELELTIENYSHRIEAINAFFKSDSFRSTSFARVAALFWATLARDIRGGRRPENFPKAGMFNDIDIVAAYAPFCDAMFVDKEISHLADQPELKSELMGCAQLYSHRKDGRESFLAYLESIEATANPEHLKLVAEVYGESWPTPFVELLGTGR